MTRGYKTGGRRKGTPNRRSDELADKIKAKCGKDFDPILGLIDLYNNADTPLDTKKDILKSIAPYMYPKRRAITTDNDTKLLVEINNVKYSRAQLLALLPPAFNARWADVCSNAMLQQVITETLTSNIKTQLLEQFQSSTDE